MRTTIVQFCDSRIVGGAEMVTATLIGALDPALPIVVVGSAPDVVGLIAAGRPNARSAVVPRIAGKRDLRGWASLARAVAGLRPRVFQLNAGGAAAGQHALLVATLLPGVRTVVVDHAATEVDNGLQRRIRAFTEGHVSAHVAPSRAAATAVETLAGLAAGSVRVIPNAVADVELQSVPRVVGGVVIGGIGVHDRVHFVGWRPGARDYLTSFDVFALPSRLESFGLVLLEAGLAGLPVVACRVGGVPEVVADGESGILVEPDDLPGLVTALQVLIDAPHLRESLGARARTGAGVQPGRDGSSVRGHLPQLASY